MHCRNDECPVCNGTITNPSRYTHYLLCYIGIIRCLYIICYTGKKDYSPVYTVSAHLSWAQYLLNNYHLTWILDNNNQNLFVFNRFISTLPWTTKIVVKNNRENLFRDLYFIYLENNRQRIINEIKPKSSTSYTVYCNHNP